MGFSRVFKLRSEIFWKFWNDKSYSLVLIIFQNFPYVEGERNRKFSKFMTLVALNSRNSVDSDIFHTYFPSIWVPSGSSTLTWSDVFNIFLPTFIHIQSFELSIITFQTGRTLINDESQEQGEKFDPWSTKIICVSRIIKGNPDQFSEGDSRFGYCQKNCSLHHIKYNFFYTTYTLFQISIIW